MDSSVCTGFALKVGHVFLRYSTGRSLGFAGFPGMRAVISLRRRAFRCECARECAQEPGDLLIRSGSKRYGGSARLQFPSFTSQKRCLYLAKQRRGQGLIASGMLQDAADMLAFHMFQIINFRSGRVVARSL